MTEYHLRGTDGVERFTGTITPNPGGGGISTEGYYQSSMGTTVGDGTEGQIMLDTLVSGDAVLDISTPATPKFAADGTYAISATFAGDALTPGGYMVAQVGNANSPLTKLASVLPDHDVAVSTVVKAVAADPLALVVGNFDGASGRDFFMVNVTVVKLS